MGIALLTSAACLVLGIAISLTAQSTGWIHLEEHQPWLPIIGLEYGFFRYRHWRVRLFQDVANPPKGVATD
jgi:hypothetical protein